MKIYTENQISNYAHSVGEPGIGVEARRVEGFANEQKQEAEQYEAKAKNVYSIALKNEATDTMDKLFEQYPDDPVALDGAFKKAYDKIIGQIADKDVKVDFMANVALSRQSYLSKAAENKRKRDYRIEKSTTYDGIDADTKTAGLAFSTLQGDYFNPDNLAVYGKAMQDAHQKINALNDDGTFMFSDEQRKEKRKALEKAHLTALKNNFNGMPSPIMKDYISKLLSDKATVGIGIDENNHIVRENLKNILPQEIYDEFKQYVEKVAKNKKYLMKNGQIIDEDEAARISGIQTQNAETIDSEIQNIKELSKKKPDKDRLKYMGVSKVGKNVERVLRNLELQDNIQRLPADGLSAKDYERQIGELRDDLLDAIKSEEDSFDDAYFQESVMSTGLQVMKRDGKIEGNAWSDDMAVVMIRDFYRMAQESGLDLRATDSGSREAAKKLASKAIENTIQMVSGGYNKEYNSLYLYGQKVSKKDLNGQPEYTNQNYIIENGKKKYIETGIEVDL